MEKEDSILPEIGAFIILFSMCLPVHLYEYNTGTRGVRTYIFLFGLFYSSISHHGDTTYVFGFDFHPMFIPGILTTISLIIMSILIIKSSDKRKGIKIMTLGIVSMVVIILEFLFMYSLFYPIMQSTTNDFLPYFGFYGILIGALIAIYGGSKLKEL